MQTLFGILVAVLVFGVMIFLHELGHYAAARACRVKVLEFAVGMGPKILSHTSKKSGIVYSLRLLPIGGFTAMQGEDGEDPDPAALVNKPRWQKLIVLFAGSLMNLLSGVLAMFVFLALTGQVGSRVVADFQEGSTSQAWLREGDEIVAIEGRSMLDYNDVVYTITLDGTEPLNITVVRDGEKMVLTDVVFPTAEEEGVLVGVLDFRFQGVRPSFSVLIKQTISQSGATAKAIYKTLGGLLTGRFGIKGVSGPVGTVSFISQAAKSGFANVLYLFAFISINLGIMNLLPLPALDGGRILFTLVECVIRRPINPKWEGYVHLAGMVVLLLFMALITVFDVWKLL